MNKSKINDEKKRELFFSGVKVYFPRKPFNTQVSLLNNIIRAFKEKSNAIIESPTGTGKVFLLKF